VEPIAPTLKCFYLKTKIHVTYPTYNPSQNAGYVSL
jgi:hypothetical protein